jgi:Holliday junction resolvase
LTAENKLARAKQPFATTDAAHVMVRAAEAMNWNLADIPSFSHRAQHVEYGLSAEIELAAILRWLGRCRFVHRLNQEVLKDPAHDPMEVPDLLAVFSDGVNKRAALIEVKTSDEMSLVFKRSYIEKLHAYAALLNLPLLIAWRPHRAGFWMLFDPSLAESLDNARVQVSFEFAVKNDLMSILAGDFHLVPKAAAGLRIEAKRIGEKQPTPNGFQAMFEISDAYFHDAAKRRVAGVPNSISWLLISAMEDHCDVGEDEIVQSFIASDGVTRAQLVLRTAVGFSLDDDQRIHWKAVGNNLDSILTCRALLADAQAHFGSFVQYVLYQQPVNMPSFVPEAWQHPHERS